MNKMLLSTTAALESISDVKVEWSKFSSHKNATYYPLYFTVNDSPSTKLALRFKGEVQAASMDANKFGKAQLAFRKEGSAMYAFFERAMKLITAAIDEYDPNRKINSPIQEKTKEGVELENPLVRIPIKFDESTKIASATFYTRKSEEDTPEPFTLYLESIRDRLPVFSKHSGIITIDSICKSDFGYSVIPKLEVDMIEPGEHQNMFDIEDVLME